MLYELRIHRVTLIIVAVGLLLVGALVFLAGYLAGAARGSGDGNPDGGAPEAAATLDEAPTAGGDAATGTAGEDPTAVDDPAAGIEEEAAAVEAPASALAAAAESLPPVHRFAIQVGAFLDDEEAAALVAELAERGHEAYVVKLRSTRSPTVLRSVRLGPFESRREAESAAARFTADEGRAAAVVRDSSGLE